MAVEFLNVDCMDYMAGLADDEFDLAVVDPPYGIGMNDGHGDKKYKSFHGRDASIPDEKYFSELFRVSKNQIIWGANYFGLKPCKNFIVWDKKMSEDVTLSMCEYAWSSFKETAKIYRQSPSSADIERIHPTQKPVKLYSWIYGRYAEKGQRILDTHLGSGSSAIAAHHFGLDFVGCELDKHYYTESKARFDREISQGRLF